MRTTLVVALAIALAGCATTPGGGGGFFDPTVVSSNERYINLIDHIGLPGKVEQMAADHCRKFGRIAQFQSRGGAGWQCSGRSSNLCSTYTCVE